MHPLSLLHIAAAVAALGVGFVMLRLRKGDLRHRTLGWWYVGLMALALAGIAARGWQNPHPFLVYAGFIAGALFAAVAASRLRRRIASWRAWHGALMSLTLLGSVLAASSIIGGALIGAGNGPSFYRLFNVLIVTGTVAGLVLINTRRVIWGADSAQKAVRMAYSTLVLGSSALLVAAQWRMAFP